MVARVSTELQQRLQTALRGSYALERELGRGGMATVFLARDLKHDRPVAIKALSPDALNASGRERFLREITIAARLSHPHILALHDSGDADGILYYVVPYVQGESLRERLEREKRIPLAETVRIACEIADALDFAHRHAVVHRDIKPENVLLADFSPDGTRSAWHAIVAAFGIGKAAHLASSEPSARTSTALAIGTPAYMSPEQASGAVDIDGRSDIYSLGAVVYEMLAGTPPFTGPNALAVLVQRFTGPPPSLRDAAPDVPQSVQRTLERALAQAREERFTTAGEFARALAASIPSGGGRDADDEGAPSIAVLPFTNMSSNPAHEYFSDGITDEVIARLAHVDGLRVVARTSCFAFKGRNLDLRDVGRQLGVRAVLEGSVRWSGPRLRITAQLIDVADGYHLWSERYDRQLADVFAIQDEIAEAIAGTLHIKLLRPAAPRRAVRSTDDLEAFQLYLKGRFYLEQRMQGMLQARRCFEESLHIDPSFAPAYASLAEAWAIMGVYGAVRPLEAFSRARENGLTALALDESLDAAHAILGYVSLIHDWNIDAAEREFQRALALNPSNASARCWYGIHLQCQWRYDEATEQAERAIVIDPLALLPRHYQGLVLYWAHRYEHALAAWQRALEMSPAYGEAHRFLGLTYHWLGRQREAEESLRRAVELSARSPWAVAMLATFLARTERARDARALLAELRDRSRAAWGPPSSLAMLHANLGEADEAFVCLEQALSSRDLWLLTLEHDEGFAPLVGDARLDALLTRMVPRQDPS